jgi:uncharacterized protein (DUF488 family)
MPLYSIGHSNVPIERFLELLQHHAITTLVDARSTPYSRYNPQFRRSELRDALLAQGIRYLFLGDKLGGKPPDNRFRRADGSVDYELVAASEFFQTGLQRLMELGATDNAAFMCAEADYKHCHRYWLITRALLQRGIAVQHILHSGALVVSSLLDFEPAQPSLF